MGFDGIRIQKENNLQHVTRLQQERQEVLNHLYRIEKPRRKRSFVRVGLIVAGIVIACVVGLWIFGLHVIDRFAPGSSSTSDVGGNVAGMRDRFETTDTASQSDGTSMAGVIDLSAWYAVHLADDKVYYGRLSTSGQSGAFILTNVFYTATNIPTEQETPTVGASDKSNTSSGADKTNTLVLVKLGTETHRPEDRIVISPEALMFFEKLRSDSPIVRAIEGYLER